MQSLRVRLLGDLQVDGCDPATLGRRQGRSLLKALALSHGRPVPVDRLAECLWGEDPPARSADQIAVLVSRLRGVIGSDRIRRTDAGYTLTLDWLDLDALEEYVNEAEVRLAAGAAAAARAAAGAGLALARGPLLGDEADARWANAERARTLRLVARLHHVAAGAALAAGDPSGAAELGRRALDTDPFDEAALRLVMSALLESGRPASALAAYAEVRHQLADELGVSPSAATEALHDAIVLAEGAPAVRADPEAAGPEALPGRGDELAALDRLLDLAMAGHGQVAVVEGEAGIGKSRLVEVWSRQLTGRAVVATACDELGRALPLQPLLDIVDQ
ncbi:MAG TPA: BTAD domain-containing putative transcriptional regulator, partial [Acidimicrobiales bacterium]